MKEIKIYEIPSIDRMELVDDPYIGMIIYVANIDAYYSVKTLKEINGVSTKGNKVVEYVIDEYLDFGSGGGGGTGLTPTQLSNIAKIPAIQSTIDNLPNAYAPKTHTHPEYASTNHRHDASEIDNLPTVGGGGTVNVSIVDNLSSTSTTSALSANQGRVLNEKLNNVNAVSLNGKKFSGPMAKNEYDAIADKDSNTIYLVDDDTTIIGVPDYSTNDANKVLSVNSDGSDLVWIDKNSIISSFLANAIFFEDDILCTSISLNTTSLTFDSSDSKTLIATVKPANTTQLVVWTTSNNNVATVSNGIVTPTGNGSCVITAKCGSYSAACSVTVNESVTIITYTITNNLTNVTNSNSATSITENNSYNATLSANSNYELSTVTVTMGGSDITNSAYSNGTITINNVTGNIVITATATEISTGEVEFTPFGNFVIGQLSSPTASSANTGVTTAVACINTGELNSGCTIGFNDDSLYSKYKFAYGLKSGSWISGSSGAYHSNNVTISQSGSYGIMIVKQQSSTFTESELSEINTSFGKLPTV